MIGELRLDAIRGVLIRLEETIIFGLIERAQYCRNACIYRPGGVGGDALGGESLVGFMLRECERSHALVRRYESPDENPFCGGLPMPVLPPLDYSDCALQPNGVNINARIRRAYEDEIVPFVCRPGDDQQYGSSAVNDVNLLQALSKRIHYGKFVAESKYREAPARFEALRAAGDGAGLEAAITAPGVEDALYRRVERKAATYAGELAAAGQHTVAPGAVRAIYERWIVPLSKEVEVRYLVERGGIRRGDRPA